MKRPTESLPAISKSELVRLTELQQKNLWLRGHQSAATVADAVRFMSSVGFALRYNGAPNLPLASMYQATFGGRDFRASKADGLRRAIELTNALLAGRRVLEVNVV